jgi:hypothetical protein
MTNDTTAMSLLRRAAETYKELLRDAKLAKQDDALWLSDYEFYLRSAQQADGQRGDDDYEALAKVRTKQWQDTQENYLALVEKRKEDIDAAFIRGVASVSCIRCGEHRAVPLINTNEAGGGECGACIALNAAPSAGDALREALEKIAGGYGVPDSMLMLPKPEFQVAFAAHLQAIARAALPESTTGDA